MEDTTSRSQINIDWSASLPATAGFGYHEQFRVAARDRVLSFVTVFGTLAGMIVAYLHG